MYAYSKQEQLSNHVIQRSNSELMETERSHSEVPTQILKARSSNSDRLAQLKALDRTQRNQADAAFRGSVIQRTVNGISLNEWLENHMLTGKKKEKFTEFFNMVHLEDSFVFLAHELDSYYKPYSSKHYSEINWDEIRNFDRFKKHVAMLRDPEGAHGAQEHTHEGGVGSQYICDRALKGRADPASYLPLDTYLTWDSKLINNHEQIFEAYMATARRLIDFIVRIAGNFYTLQNLRTAGQDNPLTQNIGIDGGEVLTLTLTSTGGDIQQTEDGFSFAVRAHIVSNKQVESISITQAAAGEKGILGVSSVLKNPEAHTGLLSPVFTINDNGVIDNAENITAAMLRWETKF